MTRHELPVERQERVTRTQPTGDTHDMHSSGATRLEWLSTMDDHEVADGEPDIRGWGMRSVDGLKIGEVDDLLVDTDLLRVRYVQITLADDLATDDDRRHAILPIGTARLDDDKDEVVVNLRAGGLRALPPYTRGELSREQERALIEHLTKSAEVTPIAHRTESDDFYGPPYFDDRSPFAGRRARSGRSNEDAQYITRT